MTKKDATDLLEDNQKLLNEISSEINGYSCKGAIHNINTINTDNEFETFVYFTNASNSNIKHKIPLALLLSLLNHRTSS